MANDNERYCCLVLGMHRAGTSALTRTISLLGWDLPDDLMAAVPGNNDSGFWESVVLSRLNDDLLFALETVWDDVQILNVVSITDGTIDNPRKAEV